ncbi:MAG: type II toxin-antitoxin system RelE/ParE family toxin [Geopsychrobacter sp.]|nr:type II toxin-antitoxin system RelE/ParE family toxin [Geopsychrobacter sp.]
MTYSFHPAAEDEFNRAINYYEEIDPGLGYDFALEVYATIQRSLEHPEAWPVLLGDMRRSLVRRFPYGIIYAKRKDELYILAVMNLHRHPDYWKKRQDS